MRARLVQRMVQRMVLLWAVLALAFGPGASAALAALAHAANCACCLERGDEARSCCADETTPAEAPSVSESRGECLCSLDAPPQPSPLVPSRPGALPAPEFACVPPARVRLPRFEVRSSAVLPMRARDALPRPSGSDGARGGRRQSALGCARL